MTADRPAVRLAALLLVLAATACAASGPRAAAERRARGLEGRPQARNLTCEARSGADLLAYHGLPGGEAEVFALLPRSDNPDLGFVGDPDDAAGGLPPAGYGVHAPPLAAALWALGLDARAERGRDLAWLASETEAGRPVIAWVTGSCAPSSRTALVDAAGRRFAAVRGEHTVLVLAVGATGTVWALDPAVGRVREFEAGEFEAAWRLLDGAAVRASGPRAGARPGPRPGPGR